MPLVPNPVQFSSVGVAVPMEGALHPPVGEQLQRPLQGMGTLMSLPLGCIVAALVLEKSERIGPLVKS